VAPSEIRAFSERERRWLGDWEAFSGDGAVADQVRFDREWGALRSYAASRGVRIIGDVPIYVAAGGCDHAAHPDLFLPLDEFVAGAPPDDLSALGQLWGNPLYDWDAMARHGYRWWIERMRRVARARRRLPDRPLPRLRRLLDRPGERRVGRDGWWSPGPGPRLPRRRGGLGPSP
jgi:4-alpha-glucanotransferase